MKNSSDFIQNPHLDGKSLFHEGSSDGVLLMHGFTATTVEVRKLAEVFIKRGFTVSAPLLPGHGTSPFDLNSKKYSHWTKTVETAFEKISSKCDHVLIAGESMGGVLSLYLAEKYPNICGILLFSPALLVRRLKFAKFIKYFQPIRDMNLPADNLPWQGYTVYPMFAADEFYKLSRKVKTKLSDVSAPALIFQGIFDKSIDPENSEYIYSNIESKIKSKVSLSNSGHVMLLDKEFSIIIDTIDDFLEKNQIFA